MTHGKGWLRCTLPNSVSLVLVFLFLFPNTVTVAYRKAIALACSSVKWPGDTAPVLHGQVLPF